MESDDTRYGGIFKIYDNDARNWKSDEKRKNIYRERP